MSRSAFRGFSLFAAFVVLTCGALGYWQLQRHSWKADLLVAAAATAAAPAKTFPDDLSQLEAYARFAVQGHFLPSYDVAIYGYAMQGVSGSRLYAPFRLTNGRTLLVQRGWVPRGQEIALQVPEKATTDGLVDLEIAWRPIEAKVQGNALFSPRNAPEMGLWTYVDLKALSDHWGLDLLSGGLGELRAPEGRSYGARVEPFVADLRNKHMEYVLTWWALAVGMAGIWLLAFIQQRKR